MKAYFYRLSLLSIVLGVLSVNTAVASDPESYQVETGNIAVSYADLNLASTTGLDLLYRRVKSAAHKVCGVDNMKVSLDLVRRNRECVSGAINNAIGEIDNPMLTALHQASLLETNQT